MFLHQVQNVAVDTKDIEILRLSLGKVEKSAIVVGLGGWQWNTILLKPVLVNVKCEA